jgi:trehalose utilization protein
VEINYIPIFMNTLCAMIDLCKKHNVYGDNYRYKYASGHIVVMEKTDNTKTNEKRKVFDEKYAKYRASKMKVLLIVDIQTLILARSVSSSGGKGAVYYYVGDNVYPDTYNDDIDVVCTNGIHYFKTLDAAYYYRGRPAMYNGKWVVSQADGFAIIE